MSTTPTVTAEGLDARRLRPSGALLGAQLALGAAIDRLAVDGTGHDPTTLDVLIRLDLAPRQQLRAADLCRRLQLSASHVSRTLDRIEAAGLIVRQPDPGDRRAQLVSFTPAGRGVVAEFAPRLQAVLKRIIFDTLTPVEIDVLVGLLGRIEQASLAELAAPDPMTLTRNNTRR